MKLRGANYDESMIEFKLKEKKFPAEIASRFSKDFLILTNGIPLFVQMISKWELRINNPEILKVYAINNKEDNEEKTSNSSSVDEIDDEIERLINDLSRKIEIYIDEKVNKFKKERYDGFDEIKKRKFKDVLLSLESQSLALIIDEYAQCVDYQLMDYDIVDNDQGSMRIRSDYPDIVKYYKKIMKIELDPKDEINLYINEMKTHIYDNNSSQINNFNTLAGHKFERIAKLYFYFHNSFNKEMNLDEIREEMENFDLYNYLFFKDDLEMNVFSKQELNSSESLNKEKLPNNHILNSKNIPKDGLSMKLMSNLFFYNSNGSTPLIDGGLIYYSSPGIQNIITYDATVGEKDWRNINIQLKEDQIETYMKRYPLKKKSGFVKNLIRVIAKLELTLPKTFRALFQLPTIEFKFEKHLVIVPNLKGKIIILIL